MKLAQTILSKLRRSDLFVENRSSQDSQLRRSGIFRRRADVAPTELEFFLDAVVTKIPRLRRWEMALAQAKNFNREIRGIHEQEFSRGLRISR